MASTSAFALNLDGPTRVAMVGAGFISAFHLEILARTPGVEVVAVCDENLAAASAAARRCGVPAAVTDIDELPRLGAQVAHLAVPPPLHFDLTRRLLELGVGVFAEKPLALSSADARALLELAASARLPLAVNHNNVFHPAFQRLARRVRAGAIGRVEHVQVTLSVPLRQLDAGDYSHWMFRAPCNIVFEQATHPLSQIHHLLGRVQSTQATLLSQRELHPGQLFIDRWLVAAEAEHGTAELYLAFGQPFTRSTLQVLGSDGCLEADLFHDTLCGEEKTLYLDFWNSFLAGQRRARALRRDALRGLFGWMGATLGLRARSDQFFVGMRESIRAFHRALRAGEPLPCDARSGVEVSEWCEAVAAGVSGAEAPRPRFPEPGGARAGEVVVLGATGFIGRRVVERLLERGVPVTAVVRRLHSLPPEISEPALAGTLRVVQGGLLDAAALARALGGAAACIHLATGSGNTWDEVERVMVRGSLGVAAACRDARVRRLVYVSSIASLYTGADCGTDEIADSTDTDPLPAWRPVYARGKAAAEKALLEFQGQHDVGLIIARPGVVLGAGTPMQHGGLGLWARDNHCVGWGRGEHPLPLVLVEDVAEALVRAALHPGSELHGKALNLCARPPLSAREMVEELARATGRRIVFHPRSLALSEAMEIGKWLVKLAGRRPGAAFPSYHDLKARSLAPRFRCELAREVLGWRPVEEREEFLERAVRVHGRAG